MGFTIDQVVPWGRSLDEYQRMFSLTEDELALRILGCADGPASVNAELRRQGKNYVSLDPIYQFSVQQIRERIDATTPVVVEQLTENQDDYLWHDYETPTQLAQVRQEAMDTFLEDFERYRDDVCYVTGVLPNLPFEDHEFDLVLCSHCLFTYSEQLDQSFHKQAVLDMCRVGQEVRVFPLLEVDGQPSRHLESVLSLSEQYALTFSVTTVDYEFQRGGNQLLTIKTS